MVVPAPGLIEMDVEGVERPDLGVLGHLACRFIGFLNREAVEHETDQRRVPTAVVGPRCVQADRVLVIVVALQWAWVAAAPVGPPRRRPQVAIGVAVEQVDSAPLHLLVDALGDVVQRLVPASRGDIDPWEQVIPIDTTILLHQAANAEDVPADTAGWLCGRKRYAKAHPLLSGVARFVECEPGPLPVRATS